MFREATVGDFDAILRLYRQLHPGDPMLTDGADRAVYRRILETAGLHLLVWEQAGAVVASSYLNVIPNLSRAAAPYAVIENVVVEEGVRGRGIGKRLMAGTLAMAWQAGCYKAMLATGSKDPATHGFYRSCGFSSDDKTSFVARPVRY